MNNPLEALVIDSEDKKGLNIVRTSSLNQYRTRKPRRYKERTETERAYSAGYKAGKAKASETTSRIRRENNEKYARWWADTNKWRLPEGVSLPGRINYDPSGQYNEERAFVYGMWYVLEDLKRGGHISDKTINKYWGSK